jgi:hypothetical protein
MTSARPTLCQHESDDHPKINIEAPVSGKVGEPFRIKITIEPKAQKPVSIDLDTGLMTFPSAKVTVNPGHASFVTGSAKITQGGIIWVHASADGYEDGWAPIDAGFAGHLKLGTTSRLKYGVPAALTLSIVDSDGKPFSVPANLSLQIVSSDATLAWQEQKGDHVEVAMSAGVRMGPQFLITPTSRTGGPIHLNGTLATNDWGLTFSQESFVLDSDPVWWLPLSFAIFGGLTYGVYKIASQLNGGLVMSWKGGAAIIITTSIAGFVGYLIASLDLLGLKLDPNLLRSYPLLGFTVAYLGVESLIPKSQRSSDKQTTDKG